MNGVSVAQITTPPLAVGSWRAPIAYALLLGAAAGTGFAAEGVLYPRYFGVRAIASIRGTAFTVSVAAATVGPILVGVAYQATGGYAVAAAILMAIPIAVGILIVLVRAPAAPEAAVT